MGSERLYKEGRQFYGYEYTTVSAKVTINGITGKMIEKKSDFYDPRNTLPSHSDTCDMYFAKGKDGYADKAKVYRDRTMVLDFDWSHTHTDKGKNGTVFQKGIVHVQTYSIVRIRQGKKWVNKFRRATKARRMTPDEIAKYGPILRHFNPNIIF